MRDKIILVLKYEENPVTSFKFYTRNDHREDTPTSPSFYISGPIGSKNHFLVVDNGPSATGRRIVEIGDTKEEAIKLAYQEALGLGKKLIKVLEHFSADVIDETGLEKLLESNSIKNPMH